MSDVTNDGSQTPPSSHSAPPNAGATGHVPPPAKRRRNLAWVGYFVVLGVLCAAAVATIWIYNLRQQLTPQELDAAEALWKENGPKDYELRYVKVLGANESSDRVFVRVRAGVVEYFTLNDDPKVDQEKGQFYTVDAMFRDLRAFLDEDAKAGRMSFLRALFDPKDGHPLWFVRRVPGTRERVEVQVKELKRL